MSWWLEQYRKGGFDETVEHHQAYARAWGLDPASLLARGMSSHFSFFNRENLTQMLEFAVEDLGYAGFNIHHGRNSKKIHFTLFT